MPDGDIEIFCDMDAKTKIFLFTKIDMLQLSARSYTRILKVARTIADMAGSNSIELDHIAEAIHFRSLDKPLVIPCQKKITAKRDFSVIKTRVI